MTPDLGDGQYEGCFDGDINFVDPMTGHCYMFFYESRTWEDGAITDTAVELGAINLLPADAGQIDAGLFGALIVEPSDAEWIIPMAGDRTNARVAAGGSVFQEYVLAYTAGEGCDAGVNYRASAWEPPLDTRPEVRSWSRTSTPAVFA